MLQKRSFGWTFAFLWRSNVKSSQVFHVLAAIWKHVFVQMFCCTVHDAFLSFSEPYEQQSFNLFEMKKRCLDYMNENSFTFFDRY